MVDAPREPLEQTAGARTVYSLSLLAVLLLGLVLRVHGLRSGLWLDELISGWVIADGFAEIPGRSWTANLSPLYFYILQLSTGLTGFDEPGLRLPSVLGGLALIVLVPGWLRSLGVRPWICVACAMLIAIDPTLLEPSTWARPTSLVIVVSLVATIAFQRIALEGSTRARDRALFVAAHAFGFYLHYLTLVLLFWQLLFAAMLWLRDRDRRFSARRLVGDCLWTGLLCLPYAAHLAQLAGGHGTLAYTDAQRLASELDRYLVVELLIVPLVASWYAAFALGQPRWLREDTLRRHGPQLNLLVFLYVVPLAGFWALSKVNLVEVTVYSRYCAPLPVLALGLVLDAIDRRVPRAIGFAMACLLVASLDEAPVRSFFAEGRFSGPYQEWKQAVAQLRSDGAAGDVVFVDSGLVEQQLLGAESPASLRDYLLVPVSGLYSLAGTGMQARPISETFVPTDAATVEAVRGAARVFVLAPAEHREAAGTVSESLARAGVHLGLERVRAFEGVTVSVLTAGSDPRAGPPSPPASATRREAAAERYRYSR